MINLFLLFLLFSFLSGCSSAPSPAEPATDLYAHIEHPKAKALIQAAIAHAGGLDNWQSIKELSYQKSFQLFDEEGALQQSVEQEHTYTYAPDLHLAIKAVEGKDTLFSAYKNGLYRRRKNGQWLTNVDQADQEKAMNAATFVVGLPFKLLDSGIRIRYIGPDTLYDGRKVEAITAHYDALSQDKHQSSEPWIFYFAMEEPILLANLVDVGDHFSLVENLSFQRVGGILWPQQRKSYRANAAGDTLYLRATYWYDDWQCQY